MSEAPLIVVVGPTASGKTSLAIQLAKQFGGEIISADSRAVYRGLDIGTAKPSIEEQAIVKHWGIDLVDPDQRFTVVDFQRYALKMIDNIRARGKVPFLVGGTGLYIDSVVYSYEFPPSSGDTNRRDEFMKWSLEDLYTYCIEHNIDLPENRKNKRYVVNNILRDGSNSRRRIDITSNSIVVGIATDKSVLRDRIEQRADSIFELGAIEEARSLALKYGWNNEAMTGNVYPLIHDYIDGRISKDEAKQRFATADWQLAKRQSTWFRRSEHIVWLSLDGAYRYIAQLLEDRSNL